MGRDFKSGSVKLEISSTAFQTGHEKTVLKIIIWLFLILECIFSPSEGN